MISKIFSPKICEKMPFLTQSTVSVCKKIIMTLSFGKNAKFFRRNLAKIGENCDHNIDTRSQSYDFSVTVTTPEASFLKLA
jgi:hypothetical protein